MKRTLKIIALCVSLVMLLQPVMALAAVEEPDDGVLTWEDVEEIGRLEAPATKAYEELLSAWRQEDKSIVFPSAFGGFYLDEDYKLAVKVVNNDEQLKEEIAQSVSNPEVLRFENTDISFNDLSVLNRTVPSLVADWDYVSLSSGIDMELGKVVIDAEVAEVAATRTIFAQTNWDPHIVIKLSLADEQQSAPQEIDYLKPGEARTSVAAASAANCGSRVSTGSTAGTLGFYGTYKFSGSVSSPCFVTAGHVGESFLSDRQNIMVGSQTVLAASNVNSSHIVYVYGNQIPAGEDTPGAGESDGDYAFVRYNTSTLAATDRLDTVSNYTLYNYDNSIALLKNKTVFKVGQVTGLTTGRVSAVGVMVNAPSDNPLLPYTILQMVEITSSSAFGQAGDSGAPVFYTSSAGLGFYTLCGVFHGQLDNHYYFTPMAVICEDGKFTPDVPLN